MNSYKQSLYVCIIRILANIFMVGAVFFAMYQASRWPAWPSEAVFCLCFFGITIPVWIAAWRLTKYVRKVFPAEFQSLVPIPRLGEQLVSWRVLGDEHYKCSLFRDAPAPDSAKALPALN